MTADPHQAAVFNGRCFTRAPTGVDRFAIELLAALARQAGPAGQPPDSGQAGPAGEALQASRPPPCVVVPANARLHDPGVARRHSLRRFGRRHGQPWEQWDLPRAAAGVPLVNLCNTAPLWLRRQMVVIHDLGTVANAGNYSAAFRHWYRLMHGTLMRRAQVVASVSRFSADALARHHGRPAGDIEVIPESGEHILRAPADGTVLQRLDLQGRRYVLAVGSLSPNKNFRSVQQAVQLLDDPGLLLVAVGGGNMRIYAPTQALQGDALRFTGYVSDAELRALYESAACFAFPSFYEGFGLPPLEAMCCGCPVIVSDRASLPEVCGSAALYCKAEDPATLAAALRRVLGSMSLQDELRQAGLQRAASFTWDSAARHISEVLRASFH